MFLLIARPRLQQKPTHQTDNLHTVTLPSTIPKSISFPQIRRDRLRNEVSSSSVHANFSSALPKHEQSVRVSSDDYQGIDAVEGLSKTVRMQRHVHFSDNLSPAVCRICHGGEISCPFNNGEPLISPCHCSGSMGLYHRSCLEKWLSTSNTDKCEICKFQYMVERQPKPWTEFIFNPGSPSIRRNMIADLLCLCVLTPMALASSWLCVAGAVAVAETGHDAIAVPGLISLAIFLMLTYSVWLTVSMRYHFQVWRDWRNANHTIRLSTPEEKCHRCSTPLDYDGNNNASPFEMIHLQPVADIHRSTDTNAAYDSPWSRYDGRRATSPFAFEYPRPGSVWDTVV